jgi:muramoyltetrapeptide carboxypeptidase LdcA involved in peptidoglycan recycling
MSACEMIALFGAVPQTLSRMTDHWQKQPIKPPRLKRGDRVAVVTPCWGGPSSFPHRYEVGKRQLASLFDFDIVEMPHALANAEWLDLNPKAHADDLMAAFADPSVKAVIASIGGDDSHRLIPHVDLEIVRQNPKVFLGYSDTTVLSFGFLKAGLVSFYGPTIMSGFAENGGPHRHMVRSLEKTLFSPAAPGLVEPSWEGWTVEYLPWADPENQSRRRTLQPFSGPRLLRGRGKVRGRLIGGCADTLESLQGTAWWPPLEVWKSALLFYETSEDAPSPRLVASWLRNLAGQGILSALGGILFARPGGRIDPAMHAEYDQELLRTLDECGLPDLPVISILDFGHTDPIFTLSYGVEAEIDCEKRSLSVVEPAVS